MSLRRLKRIKTIATNLALLTSESFRKCWFWAIELEGKEFLKKANNG